MGSNSEYRGKEEKPTPKALYHGADNARRRETGEQCCTLCPGGDSEGISATGLAVSALRRGRVEPPAPGHTVGRTTCKPLPPS